MKRRKNKRRAAGSPAHAAGKVDQASQVIPLAAAMAAAAERSMSALKLWHPAHPDMQSAGRGTASHALHVCMHPHPLPCYADRPCVHHSCVQRSGSIGPITAVATFREEARSTSFSGSPRSGVTPRHGSRTGTPTRAGSLDGGHASAV